MLKKAFKIITIFGILKSPYPWVLQMWQKVWAKFKNPLLVGYSQFWFDFFILGRLIMLSLDKWFRFSIISIYFILFIFLYLRNIRKTTIVTSI